MGSRIKWRTMGERAAAKGKPETACPFAMGGAPWRHWMSGYRDEEKRIAEHLSDMEELQKQERS